MRNARSSGARNGPKLPLNHEPEAVTYARERAGLTKIQLAKAVGVAVSLISEIERGTRNATPAMINKLAGVLRCPPAALRRGAVVGRSAELRLLAELVFRYPARARELVAQLPAADSDRRGSRER